jgi:hypothetical protein
MEQFVSLQIANDLYAFLETVLSLMLAQKAFLSSVLQSLVVFIPPKLDDCKTIAHNLYFK